MDETTKTLVDRLQEYADEDADLGYKTNRAQAFLEARAAIERQARDIVELKDEEASAESGLVACYEAAGLSGEISWARLVEAIEGMRKDAVRWRHMRRFGENGVPVTPPVELVHACCYSHTVGSIPRTRVVRGEELDRLADAAIAAKEAT